ncbi:vWA domain-containing protein [Streptomyces sp. 8L]|uniref:vWA domain-containing protein n=1 Tax=Streptomyces sp. 8L TaxID=2877242 RepID=UPI001CD630F1|nr:VWA domain-containing protein [Streptomyces sp. 8L]MCA1217744.1 VWA domain-containing protein [Streptomyces sp. 8L]
MEEPAHPLLPAVDRAAFAVALADRLRSRGVRAGLSALDDLVRALDSVPSLDRSSLYWAARVCLVHDHGQLAVFDEVFQAVFGDAVLGVDPNARRDGLGGHARSGDDRYASLPAGAGTETEGAGLPWVTAPRVVAPAEQEEEASSLTVPERLPAALVSLADVPFEQLAPHETALLGQWLEQALRTWPTRRSRRFDERRGGSRVLLRATVARARHTGWEPVRLVRAAPVRRPRRVVMLCDVSRSMQQHAVAYLHLMRALTRGTDAEVFAFATSLTRLTAVLAHRSAETAIDEATERVEDRFGGTRIATCLRDLLASHHGGLLRGAVVVIASDGWDSDRPEALAAAMDRLSRRAHRVVWLNPRASAPGFVPRTTTMTAALPYCDALLPAGTFSALRESLGTLTTARTRGSAARGPRLSSTG